MILEELKPLCSIDRLKNVEVLGKDIVSTLLESF